MTIKVRLFALLKQHASRGVVELELPPGSTVADAVAAVGRETGISDVLARMPLGHAVNREYVADDLLLADGDELALIPPVSGGAAGPTSARVHAAIIDEAPSLDRLSAFVSDPAAGAVVSFQGVTREVDRLEYEAFAEMAEPLLAEILGSIAEEFSLTAIAAEHRVGAVPLGQASIVICASSPHRPEAFAGARAAIDRIKAELPVWKREVASGESGETSSWVEGTPIEAGER